MNARAFTLCFALMLLAGPAIGAGHERPIQPGAQHMIANGTWCSLNLVFRSVENETLYIGTADHCTRELGQRIRVPEVGEIGTVVYRTSSATFADGGRRDFALIAIDQNRLSLVDPAVRRWGGPTGVDTTFTPGTPLLQYGQGIVISSTEATRGRGGILEWTYGHTAPAALDIPEYRGWYLADLPVINGDSGSIILTAEGKALGVAAEPVGVAGQPGYLAGPTFALILDDLAKAGWHIEVVRSEMTTNAEAAGQEATRVKDQCTNEPIGGESTDSCVGMAYPNKRRGAGQGIPPDAQKELLFEATILAGSPSGQYFSLARNPTGFGPPTQPVPIDSFEFPAPAPGTLIGTETSAPEGVAYDVDLNFYRGANHYWVDDCATPAPDDACHVPDRATTVGVTAFAGADLHVRVYGYTVDG